MMRARKIKFKTNFISINDAIRKLHEIKVHTIGIEYGFTLFLFKLKSADFFISPECLYLFIFYYLSILLQPFL